LKEIRNILIGLTNSTKSWEIAVGQTIGKMANRQLQKNVSENKICNFLGAKFMSNFLPD
jgi:hypothetical protein